MLSMPGPDEFDTIAAPMKRLRDAFRGERSPRGRKAALLAEFDRMRRPAPHFQWAFAVAASVLVLASAGLMWRGGAPPPETRAQAAVVEMAGVDGDDFVPVPYAPPLAAGEMVEVVRTELQASALYRMGVLAPGMSGASFDAEVMVGQDGLPRAVRVLATDGFEN